ncbi:MAG: hypothetical protein QOH43_1787 [Solirubrobacteraceae bacterium]|jgi:hypothetical protein|nr:hypothetical protein [Solirubrobacteraceae bacterium]
MAERFSRRQGHVPGAGRQAATRHLLRHSSLGVELDEHWDDDRGGPDWKHLMWERGQRAQDAVLIALAEELWSGALGGFGQLDEGDRGAVLHALGMLQEAGEGSATTS